MGTAMPRGFYMNKKKWVYTVAAVLVALLLISLLMGDEETAARLSAMLISVVVGVGLDYCDIEWFALERNRSFCRF